MAMDLFIFIASRGGQKGHMLPPTPPPHPHSRHCRIMNDFFLAFGSCGGGGEGHGNLSPPYPYPTQSIYICVGVVAEGTGRLSRILHG